MIRRFIFAVFLASTATGALAQYKCAIAGKTVYADAPCARDAKPVGELQDSVSAQQRRERAQVAAREHAQLGLVQEQQYRDQRIQSIRAENANAQMRAEQAARSSRCASAQGDKTYNDRRVARYQDWGWGNSQQQARAERDAAERRMRDSCD